MPISRVQVNEYECLLCGYKWVNRVNGKDGPVPERCAKCKRYGWNGERTDAMTPEDSGLRRRIKNLYRLYKIAIWRVTDPLPDIDTFSIDDYLDPEVVAMFLCLDNPRLTHLQLLQVLYPQGLELRLDSQNSIRREAYYPDPDKPGWLKRDKPPYKRYLKVVKADAQKQQQAMEEIIIKQEGTDWRKKAQQMQKEEAAEREAKRKEREERVALLDATREARTAEILAKAAVAKAEADYENSKK